MDVFESLMEGMLVCVLEGVLEGVSNELTELHRTIIHCYLPNNDIPLLSKVPIIDCMGETMKLTSFVNREVNCPLLFPSKNATS